MSIVGFNIGFYLVVPFLAVHLADDLGLAAGVIGTVLGLRMLAQQGLFFLGGALAERLGYRRTALSGIAVRVTGFGVLAVADSLATVITGVLLVGAAAALFAPAVEGANAAYGRQLEDAGVLPRAEVFGLEQMAGRVGMVMGPILGALLLTVPFAWTAGVAAALFAVIGMLFVRWFPEPPRRDADVVSIVGVVRVVARNGEFLAYAGLWAIQLAAVSLVYLMLPMELAAVGADRFVGWAYVVAALVVLGGQIPMLRIIARIGNRRALIWGFLIMGGGFAVPSIVPVTPLWVVMGVLGWLVLLNAGQMLLVPALRDAVAATARETYLSAHFGAMNSLGGVLCVVASAAAGSAYAAIGATPWGRAMVWSVAAVCIAGGAAVTLAALSRRRRAIALRPEGASG
ncbi:MFS transporter [Nocardia fluminea]|uniref:MFS transporter n=1 Tax=Nocardia fluminea TaxID=134984 RepID=UPI003670DCC2